MKIPVGELANILHWFKNMFTWLTQKQRTDRVTFKCQIKSYEMSQNLSKDFLNKTLDKLGNRQFRSSNPTNRKNTQQFSPRYNI